MSKAGFPRAGKLSLFTVVIFGLLSAGLVFAMSARSEPQAVQTPSPLEQSDALVAAAPLADGVVVESATFAPQDLRGIARGISEQEIPLPPGLNTAADLDWAKQSEMGPIGERDIRSLLQANAARDWAWFAAHNTLTADQSTILAQIPEWPALRGNALGALYKDAFTRILAGDLDWGQEFAARQFRERGGEPARNAAW